MDKNIFIHIGIHKTGTTAIQFWLENNKEALQAAGTLYPMDRLRQHRLVSRDKDRQPSITEENDGFWMQLREEVEESKVENVVISSENFSTGYADARREYIESLYERVKEYNPRIIVFLRRQDSFFESMYTQIIKTGNNPGFSSLEDMIERTNLDYAMMLDRWSSVFGKENVHVGIYDKDGEIDPFMYFQGWLGLSGKLRLALPERTHMKPGIQHLRALVYIREALGTSRGIRVNEEILSPLVNATRHWPRRREYKLIPYQVAKAILDRYHESNLTVAEKYLQYGKAGVLDHELEEYDQESLDISGMDRSMLLDLLEFLKSNFRMHLKKQRGHADILPERKLKARH